MIACARSLSVTGADCNKAAIQFKRPDFSANCEGFETFLFRARRVVTGKHVIHESPNLSHAYPSARFDRSMLINGRAAS
jgi:hypothetical protein